MFHFRQRYALEIGETVVNGLREDIFRKVQRQPMSFFHRTKLGRIISRVTSDVEAVRVGIQDVAFVSAIQFGQMVFSGVVMAYYDLPLFLVLAAMAPVLWLVNNHFRMKFSRLTRASQQSFRPRHGDPRRVGQRYSGYAGVCPSGNKRWAISQSSCRPIPQH